MEKITVTRRVNESINVFGTKFKFTYSEKSSYNNAIDMLLGNHINCDAIILTADDVTVAYEVPNGKLENGIEFDTIRVASDVRLYADGFYVETLIRNQTPKFVSVEFKRSKKTVAKFSKHF